MYNDTWEQDYMEFVEGNSLTDGEWMRSWENTCREDGAILAYDSVICQEAPDDDAVNACQELGAALA